MAVRDGAGFGSVRTCVRVFEGGYVRGREDVSILLMSCTSM
jgi:hypothetical protein